MPTNPEILTRTLELTSHSIVDAESRLVRLSFSSEEPVTRQSFFSDPWVEVLGHDAGEVDTGSGKSCTVATVLQSLFEKKIEYLARGATFIILDVNGEYTLMELARKSLEVRGVAVNRTLLQWALNDLGITGKGGIMEDIFGGIKGIFGGGGSSGGGLGGILGGIGDFFGGFFADGGRLAPGQFGVVGENGPELAYAGNAPMHITPGAGMAAAPISVTMNVQTPDIYSFRQSQSQIAADMARSIERARRNL